MSKKYDENQDIARGSLISAFRAKYFVGSAQFHHSRIKPLKYFNFATEFVTLLHVPTASGGSQCGFVVSSHPLLSSSFLLQQAIPLPQVLSYSCSFDYFHANLLFFGRCNVSVSWKRSYRSTYKSVRMNFHFHLMREQYWEANSRLLRDTAALTFSTSHHFMGISERYAKVCKLCSYPGILSHAVTIH